MTSVVQVTPDLEATTVWPEELNATSGLLFLFSRMAEAVAGLVAGPAFSAAWSTVHEEALP